MKNIVKKNKKISCLYIHIIFTYTTMQSICEMHVFGNMVRSEDFVSPPITRSILFQELYKPWM